MRIPARYEITNPELVDTKAVENAMSVLVGHVKASTTPAAVATILNPDGVIARWSAGWHTYGDEAKPTEITDLFDLASVTKVVATGMLFALLSEEGTIDLDAPVTETIPEFADDRRITARTLLAHCGGLPAHVHLYKRLIDREEVIRAVCGMSLEYEPLSTSVYSDMGYILLGEMLERTTGRPLNELFRDYVREPLGLHETVFSPGISARDRIVPTEDDQSWRGRLVHGEVHDENASVMRGIAPHAGLFSTVDNVSRVAQLWLNEGTLDGRSYLGADTIRAFRSRANLTEGSTWALGWDTVSPGMSTSGRHFSAESYGILGFTGTSVWVDPEREVAVVLLTNRVYPTRENWGIKQLRPEFHDAAMQTLSLDTPMM
jgi:CubicO group peptidase (beta-lactamase class C family)